MKTKLTIIMSAIISSLCIANPAKERGYPYAEISNGVISAAVSVDTQSKYNYYRGQRFDWAGQIYSLTFKNHSYFGEWFYVEYDPYCHDAICGPTDEFTQIGYENASAGGEFLKIGVGILQKNENVPYSFRDSFVIVDAGKWDVSVSKNAITYKQTLNSKIASYIYTKTIELVEGSPVMKIKYSLKNTGNTKIDTMVYNHNFFRLDNELTNPSISLQFAFEPKKIEAKLRLAEKISNLVKNKISFTRGFTMSDMVLYRNIDGENKIENNDFKLENSRTGAAVRITGDRPLLKATFWACQKTYCIEPFVKIDVPAGEEFTWSNSYEFYTTK